MKSLKQIARELNDAGLKIVNIDNKHIIVNAQEGPIDYYYNPG